MATKALKLWIYSGRVVGQTRVMLIADTTVGGAKGRFSGSHGTPSAKNAIETGIPAWINGPGAWISRAPVKQGAFGSLDRYSQDMRPEVPSCRPVEESAYVHADTFYQAQIRLEEELEQVLRKHYPAVALGHGSDGEA